LGGEILADQRRRIGRCHIVKQAEPCQPAIDQIGKRNVRRGRVESAGPDFGVDQRGGGRVSGVVCVLRRQPEYRRSGECYDLRTNQRFTLKRAADGAGGP
jgi:hypothetical protein